MSQFESKHKECSEVAQVHSAHAFNGLKDSTRFFQKLASALLRIGVMIAFAFTTMACPLYRLEVDEEANSAPVIVSSQLSPQPGVSPEPVLIRDGSAHTTFRATVYDQDGDQEIFVKWILTAQSGSEGAPLIIRELEQQQVQAIPEPEAGEARSPLLDEVFGVGTNIGATTLFGDVSLELSEAKITDDPERFAGPPKTHLLELFVSDRQFKFGLLETEPEQQEGEPKQIAARAAWLLEFVDVR